MIDLWDGVGVVGSGLVVAGVGFVYWPAALVLAGGGLVGLYLLRETRLAAQSATRERAARRHD